MKQMHERDRDSVIAQTSVLGVVVNVLLAAVKVAAGLFASSIAIVSEGVNNAADALTSVLTLVGTKLAGRHPDEKHPFGYGRIEYLTALVISVVILVSGVQMAIESMRLLFKPEPLEISHVSLAIVAVSGVVKFILGVYAVDNDHEESVRVRRAVASFVRGHDEVKSFHAVYLEPGTNRLYCDLIVSYALRDWDALRAEFLAYMKNLFPENGIELTVETEFV